MLARFRTQKNAHKVKNDQGVVHVALLSACVIHVH